MKFKPEPEPPYFTLLYRPRVVDTEIVGINHQSES